MLSSIEIKNFAIIDKLTLEFSPGFNVLTGETGAGKSIVIGAIQLLLGQRAEKSLIRKDEDTCEVQGVFEFHGNIACTREINSFLDNRGISTCEGDVLIIKRIIKANSSRVFINSNPVVLSVLTELGEALIDIHGPYDHQALIQPPKQRELLDRYSEIAEILGQYQVLFQQFHEIEQKIRKLDTESKTPAELEVLQFQQKEIQDAELKEGEEQELNQRHTLISNARKILEISNQSIQRLEGESAVFEQLSEMMRDFYELKRIDPHGGEKLIHSLEEIIENLRDLASELTSYEHRIDLDQQEIIQIEERLSLLQKLKRKYGGDIPMILEVAQKLQTKLEMLSNLEKSRQELVQEKEKALARATKCAKDLSQKRRDVAKKLSIGISDKLKNLGFKESSFHIDHQEMALGPTGIDEISYLFSPNPGEGFKPLKNIASNGEISRVMLAIKTVLAKADLTPTLIFDEIDANIGGTTAAKVGSSLSSLAQDRQVLCITHLPQVAAGAARHFLVEKSTANGRTLTTITPLTEDQRPPEIARMLGGKESTSVALTHARELIEKANHADKVKN